MKGGHPNTGLQHWHFYIKFPNGATKQINELFAKTEQGEDGPVVSANVKDIYETVDDLIRRSYNVRYDDPVEPYTLYWKGRKLDRPDVKVRHISVDKLKIPLYDGSAFSPLTLKFNKDIVPETDLPTHELTIDYNTEDEK